MALAVLDETASHLCDRIKHLLSRQASCPQQRILIALAGVPGSGKTTISSAVLERLCSQGINDVVVVPMDGFHYSKAALTALPDPDLAFQRRGAPFTFDAAGVVQLVGLLKSMPVTTATEPEIVARAPSFDHAIKDPIVDDLTISSRTRVVIVEGNYTLLDVAPWSEIAAVVDERWFVDVDPEVARDRLVKRHILAGIETSIESATSRVTINDLPNGELIRDKLIEPDERIIN